MEKNPKREKNPESVDYTTEDAIIVIEKAMNTSKPKTINTRENGVQTLCMTLQDL